MDWMHRLDVGWTTKFYAALGGVFGVGGYAADRSASAPLISEAVIFTALGHGWTLAGISLALGVLASAIALLRVLTGLARGLWEFFR